MIDRDLNRQAEIDSRLRDNIAELVTHIQGERGERHGNEMRWGNKGGLCVMVAGRDKGRITRFDGDGRGRTPLTFIMEERGCSFPQAVEWAANWLGLSRDYKPDPEAERRSQEKRGREQCEAEAEAQAEQAQRLAKAVEIVDRTIDATGTPAAAYLAARGITVALPDDIRFLPPRNGGYGALVAVARNNAGNICAVQRIFIDGDKKAAVEVVKRTNGVMDGAAVRLPGSRGDELVLAEGPETGLSVWQAWGRETWVALGSIATLVEVVPPDRPIVIARDADQPNSQADKALMNAVAVLIERGCSVFIATPPNPTKPGYDFNDALQDYGDEVVAAALVQSMTMTGNDLPVFKDLGVARADVQHVVREFFDEASGDQVTSTWLVNVGLGIGKTKTALKEAGQHIKAKKPAKGFGK